MSYFLCFISFFFFFCLSLFFALRRQTLNVTKAGPQSPRVTWALGRGWRVTGLQRWLEMTLFHDSINFHFFPTIERHSLLIWELSCNVKFKTCIHAILFRMVAILHQKANNWSHTFRYAIVLQILELNIYTQCIICYYFFSGDFRNRIQTVFYCCTSKFRRPSKHMLIRERTIRIW